MDLHVFTSPDPEHDLTIFRKCLSVCDSNFVDSLPQKVLMKFHEILYFIAS